MLKREFGFSLVELLISLLLGSVLLAMVIGLYVTGVSTSASSLKYSRLRSDLQSMISMMETDIRRAGFGGSDFMVGSGASKTIDSSATCIIYSYDHDVTGSLNNSNKMGIRLQATDNEIQFGTGVDPLVSNCYSYTGATWITLSDKQFIKITTLNFTESITSNASATIRSVQIQLTGELASDSNYSHSINSTVQVRNIELN